MKLTKIIDGLGGTRCVRVVVTRDASVVTMRVRRIAPWPEVDGRELLFSPIRQPADADKVSLQIFGARAHGKLGATEATELIEIVNTIRSALPAMRVVAAMGAGR